MMHLEGKTPACHLREELRARAASLAAAGRPARLAAVLVGENPSAALYLQRKVKLGQDLGVAVEAHQLATVTEEELVALLRRLSLRNDVDGILVEQPLPRTIAMAGLIHAIAPAKDVDGATGQTQGLLAGNAGGLVPATPLAVMRLLKHYGISLRGAHVVIVGHSPVVGKPLALLMLREDATVTVCHKETRDLAHHTGQADIVVVAAGVPGLIRGDMIRPGAILVDVGINVVDGRTVGDVDAASVQGIAGGLTPVPGGVGPLTTLTILENTLLSAERRAALDVGAAD